MVLRPCPRRFTSTAELCPAHRHPWSTIDARQDTRGGAIPALAPKSIRAQMTLKGIAGGVTEVLGGCEWSAWGGVWQSPPQRRRAIGIGRRRCGRGHEDAAARSQGCLRPPCGGHGFGACRSPLSAIRPPRLEPQTARTLPPPPANRPSTEAAASSPRHPRPRFRSPS